MDSVPEQAVGKMTPMGNYRCRALYMAAKGTTANVELEYLDAMRTTLSIAGGSKVIFKFISVSDSSL